MLMADIQPKQMTDPHWEKTKEYIYDRIDHHKEFYVLRRAWENTCSGELEMGYIDYCLDWYNYHTKMGKTKREAKFLALTETIYRISIDNKDDANNYENLYG